MPKVTLLCKMGKNTLSSDVLENEYKEALPDT